MSVEDTKNLDFNSALKSLSEISKTFNVEIYIPSLKKKVKFKELNAKQQKLLLQTVTDNSLYKVQFSKQFLNIIEENNLSEESLETFTVFDKIFIGLGLRNSVSSKLNVIFNETPSVVEEINLSKIIDNGQKYTHPQPITLKFNKNDLELEVSLLTPSVIVENKFEEELYKNYKKVDDIKNADEIGVILSGAFVGEISKYISQIKIGDQFLNFSSLSVSQKIKVVEQLSGDIIQSILTQISNWKENINEFLTVETVDKKYSKVITLDTLLFLM